MPHEITPKRAQCWLRCMWEAFQEVGLDKHPAGHFFFDRLKQVSAIIVNTPDTEA